MGDFVGPRMDASELGCYLVMVFGLVCLIPLLWFACCQAGLLNFLFHHLHLPCTVRVH